MESLVPQGHACKEANEARCHAILLSPGNVLITTPICRISSQCWWLTVTQPITIYVYRKSKIKWKKGIFTVFRLLSLCSNKKLFIHRCELQIIEQ